MDTTINKVWHEQNRMPKNPTIEQRIAWHLEHSKNCRCRKIERKIAEEMIKRGIKF
jgi:hypothetical protein